MRRVKAWQVVTVLAFAAFFGLAVMLRSPVPEGVQSVDTIDEPTPQDAVPTPTAIAPLPTREPDTAVEAVTVARVVDGDTIVAEDHGMRRTVRILGIDTPETVHPTKGVQCFGPEASAETKKLLPARSQATLTFEGAHEDRYGRLLAYVATARGQDVSSVLVEQGFARAYPQSSRYHVARTPELVALEQKARSAK